MANITRNFNNITATLDQKEMVTNFNNMLKKVCDMIETQGPIYSVWICFQIGENNPIIFNSASNNIKENLIAELSFQKTGAGTANAFTLKINYDPFNHGQNTTDKIEALDSLIADLISYDIDEENSAKFRGYLQYGYNYTQDTNMISPKYELLISKANSSVDWSSGITVYTFEGVSYLSPKCNIQASFGAIGEDGQSTWKLTDLVRWVLYQYYGDPDNAPEPYITKGTETLNDGERYLIDVPERLQDDAPEVSVPAVNNKNPFEYCEMVMKGQMSKSDTEKYKDKDITDAQKPKYVLSITDEAGRKTIHMNYINPMDGENNLKLDFQFSWNQKSKNIVQQWNPEVNLYYFLIKQSSLNYEKRKLENIMSSNASDEDKKIAQDNYNSQVDQLSDQAYEMYYSTLITVGIPGDLPVLTEMDIIPKIAESVSRTQGVYGVTSITDNISTKGVYNSEFKVIRLRNIGETVIPQEKEDVITNTPS
jgi:hypothetical protein